jgi:hypothetical protein
MIKNLFKKKKKLNFFLKKNHLPSIHSIFEKWDANWHKSYYKFAYDYGVEK